MKVSELSGAQLNYWVARAEGMQQVRINHDGEPPYCYMWERELGFCSGDVWEPSTIWKQGGPIIERERIDLAAPCEAGTFSKIWTANTEWGEQEGYQGETALIAAMRAYVASKFGDEVADEEAV